MPIALMIFPLTKPERLLFPPQNPKGSQVLTKTHSRKYISIAFGSQFIGKVLLNIMLVRENHSVWLTCRHLKGVYRKMCSKNSYMTHSFFFTIFSKPIIFLIIHVGSTIRQQVLGELKKKFKCISEVEDALGITIIFLHLHAKKRISITDLNQILL